MRDLMAKFRPQILLLVIVLGVIASYALHLGFTEVATGAVAGMIALGMQILQDKD